MKKASFYLAAGSLLFISPDAKAEAYLGIGAGLTTLTGTASFTNQLRPPSDFSFTVKSQQSGQAFAFSVFCGHLQKVYGPFKIGLDAAVDFSKPQSNYSLTVPRSFVDPGTSRTFGITVRKDPVVSLTVKFGANITPNIIPYVKLGAAFAGFSYIVSGNGDQLAALKRYTTGFTAALGALFKVTSHFFIAAEDNFTAYQTIRLPNASFRRGDAVTQIKSISQTHSLRLGFGYLF